MKLLACVDDPTISLCYGFSKNKKVSHIEFEGHKITDLHWINKTADAIDGE